MNSELYQLVKDLWYYYVSIYCIQCLRCKCNIFDRIFSHIVYLVFFRKSFSRNWICHRSSILLIFAWCCSTPDEHVECWTTEKSMICFISFCGIDFEWSITIMCCQGQYPWPTVSFSLPFYFVVFVFIPSEKQSRQVTSVKQQ